MKQEEIIPDYKRRKEIVQRVKHIVAEKFGGVPEDVIFSKSRKREIVVSRQVVQYLLKTYTKWSLEFIGSVTGGRDHATVLHAMKTISNLIDTEKEFAETMKRIERDVRAKAITFKHEYIPLVLLESPYYNNGEEGVPENKKYAQECLRHSLMEGESPMASHLIYTQVLNEETERFIGINAALSWQQVVDKVVVYCDRGVSEGMTQSINRAIDRGIDVEYRKIYTNESF